VSEHKSEQKSEQEREVKVSEKARASKWVEKKQWDGERLRGNKVKGWFMNVFASCE